MFTGLIEEVGRVESVAAAGHSTLRIRISAPRLVPRLRTGDSISVSGVCLTALDIGNGGFSADLARETVERTSLSRLAAGSAVNLELPTPAGAPLGGHVVQGHVDGTGRLVEFRPSGQQSEDWLLTVELPDGLERYAVEKGSLAVEGISLTIARLSGREATIAVIPHTYSATNLRELKPGHMLNVETDVLARYAEKRAWIADKPRSITLERLIRAGF